MNGDGMKHDSGGRSVTQKWEPYRAKYRPAECTNTDSCWVKTGSRPSVVQNAFRCAECGGLIKAPDHPAAKDIREFGL